MIKMTSKKVRELVDRLSAVIGPDDVCDMYVAAYQVNSGKPTYGCHGGWLAIALGDSLSGGYIEGKVLLARFFGIDTNMHSMANRLLEQDPDLWGYGEQVRVAFCSGQAFGQSSDIFPATVIINQWRKIAERLEEREGLET